MAMLRKIDDLVLLMFFLLLSRHLVDEDHCSTPSEQGQEFKQKHDAVCIFRLEGLFPVM